MKRLRILLAMAGLGLLLLSGVVYAEETATAVPEASAPEAQPASTAATDLEAAPAPAPEAAPAEEATAAPAEETPITPPAEMAPAPEAPAMMIPEKDKLPARTITLHQVKAGEDLHLISAYYYGDARQWKKIWEFNKKEIKNPNRIAIGQILKIEMKPGAKPKFNMEQYLAQRGLGGAARTVAPRQTTYVREKEEVRAKLQPRLLEEQPKEAPAEQPQKTPSESAPAPK